MLDSNGYTNVDEGVRHVSVDRMQQMPKPASSSYPDDIEVINLDDPRRNIKPTTWH